MLEYIIRDLYATAAAFCLIPTVLYHVGSDLHGKRTVTQNLMLAIAYLACAAMFIVALAY